MSYVRFTPESGDNSRSPVNQSAVGVSLSISGARSDAEMMSYRATFCFFPIYSRNILKHAHEHISASRMLRGRGPART